MQAQMEKYVGIYRDEKSLKDACGIIAALKTRLKNGIVEDKDHVYNTDLVSALELDFMIDVAETICYSALLRRESRGAHYRTDYTKRDDTSFLKHSMAHKTSGPPKIDYSTVTITRWKPEERVY